MDKSSSPAPFAFILHPSPPGSECSCFRPARKLHLKLALRSEWLISHLTGMKVNERSNETASPLLYIHPKRPSPIYENHSSTCGWWLPEKVSESRIMSGMEKKIQHGSWCPFPLASTVFTNKSRNIFLVCSAPLVFSSSAVPVNWSFWRMKGRAWISLIHSKKCSWIDLSAGFHCEFKEIISLGVFRNSEWAEDMSCTVGPKPRF